MSLEQRLNDYDFESHRKRKDKMTKRDDNGFYDLGISPNLLNNIKQLKFDTPTPIQKDAIPAGIQGDDIIGLAQTGSGKTIAYGIPMLQRLSKSKDGVGTRVRVWVPLTEDAADQLRRGGK